MIGRRVLFRGQEGTVVNGGFSPTHGETQWVVQLDGGGRLESAFTRDLEVLA